MNWRQCSLLLFAALVFVGTWLYCPWVNVERLHVVAAPLSRPAESTREVLERRVSSAGYFWRWRTPEAKVTESDTELTKRVDYRRLALQWAVLAAVTFVGLIGLRTRKPATRRLDAQQRKRSPGALD